MNSLKNYTILFCLFAYLNSSAQISFSDNSSVLSQQDFHSGIPIAISDLNGDNLDDIVRLDSATRMYIEYQVPGAQFETQYIGWISFINEWSIAIADVDNNGYNDLYFGGKYDDIKVMRFLNASGDYEIDLYTQNFFAQGANYADINNDGHVDLFVCNDDFDSRKFRNQGDGSFILDQALINTETTPSSDNSGNYGSIWTDFDNDGDLDLYIAKCRQGVGNPNDPRRINMLLENDGNNNFTENAEEYNVKIGAQSWTADFNDIDNDGDLDLFISNHDIISQLLENDGTGHYTDITATSGLDDMNIMIMQAFFRDFDNDGFMDLILTGSNDRLYHNNGDKTFSLVSNPFGNQGVESLAVGDLNTDGFLDIYAGYAQVFNTPNFARNDKIWMNDGNSNNFIAFNIEGTVSNRSGIGARLELYGEWGVQIREVRSGESYGIMNTLTQHFGLGTSTSIDSLIVKWPSGIVDKFTDGLGVNVFKEVLEGDALLTVNNITHSTLNPIVRPNPSSGNFRIQFEDSAKQLKIFNLEGKVVFETPVYQSGTAINLDLPVGNYVYILSGMDGFALGRGQLSVVR